MSTKKQAKPETEPETKSNISRWYEAKRTVADNFRRLATAYLQIREEIKLACGQDCNNSIITNKFTLVFDTDKPGGYIGNIFSYTSINVLDVTAHQSLKLEQFEELALELSNFPYSFLRSVMEDSL